MTAEYYWTLPTRGDGEERLGATREPRRLDRGGRPLVAVHPRRPAWSLRLLRPPGPDRPGRSSVGIQRRVRSVRPSGRGLVDRLGRPGPGIPDAWSSSPNSPPPSPRRCTPPRCRPPSSASRAGGWAGSWRSTEIRPSGAALRRSRRGARSLRSGRRVPRHGHRHLGRRRASRIEGRFFEVEEGGLRDPLTRYRRPPVTLSGATPEALALSADARRRPPLGVAPARRAGAAQA